MARDGARSETPPERDETSWHAILLTRGCHVWTAPALNAKMGAYKVLHAFAGGQDGLTPNACFIVASRLLYGTTTQGGTVREDQGTVFSLNPASGAERILHAFKGGGDGAVSWRCGPSCIARAAPWRRNRPRARLMPSPSTTPSHPSEELCVAPCLIPQGSANGPAVFCTFASNISAIYPPRRRTTLSAPYHHSPARARAYRGTVGGVADRAYPCGGLSGEQRT